AAPAPPRHGAARASGLSNVRVLVVDDEEDARDAAALILEQCGAVVAKAGSGSEAMSAPASFTPDVMVSDIAMPSEDGFELIRRVRALSHPWAATIPAVALTAYAREEERRAILAAGYQSWMTKPIDSATLARGIAELVGDGRSR